tara:strand:+ start:63 stop:458 length:396 start_codon:yes stop_codon:yes gene_type:complete
MNRRELNNLIKEELEAAVRESAIPGHPSYLEEAEDMEAGDMEGGEEGEEELMDSLKGFYEKLKAHFDGEGGEEKTEKEEDEMEEEEEDPEEVEEGKKKKTKKGEEGKKKEDELGKLNESIKRFQKLANIRG